MSWKDIKQSGCSSLGAPQPAGAWVSPTLLLHHRPSFHSSILWGHKGEVNEAWGGNYTNANRQMSHIVPSYNKQYGCLWCICIRKGGALRKPCFDCILQGADYFFPGPPAFFRIISVAFLGDFSFLFFFFFLFLAKLWVGGLVVEVLSVKDSCALCKSCESSYCLKSTLHEVKRCLAVVLCSTCGLKLCGHLYFGPWHFPLIPNKLCFEHSWNICHCFFVMVINIAEKMALG